MITAQEIVAVFGGGTITSAGDVLVAAPGHSRKDRSLCIKPLLDGRVLGHSFSPRDDKMAMLHCVEERLGISGRSRSTSRPTRPPTSPPPPTSRTTADPLALRNASLNPIGSPVERYLVRRGVLDAGQAAFGHAIRFHPNCPFGPGKRVPCMVALVTDIRTAKPQAIHRTAIDADGKKVFVEDEGGRRGDRLSLGPTKGGCIRLTLDENVETCLGIGEGIETTLSLQSLPEFGATPVWSCIYADNIKNFPVLPGIECLWIAVDHEDAGITGAHAAAGAWHASGRDVFLSQHKQHRKELNNVLIGAENV
jgi:putative DNA primase/helicase